MKLYKLTYTGSIPITIVGYGEIQPNTFKMVDLQTAVSFVEAKNFQVDLSTIRLEKEEKKEELEAERKPKQFYKIKNKLDL